MRSGIFRRRKAMVAAALVAGSALAAGVPALVSQNTHDSADAATATITLRVNSIPGVVGPVVVTFTKLGGITYDVGPPQPCGTNCKPTPAPIAPTITLRDPFATDMATYRDMLAWERAVRAGNPAGRETATLTLTDITGTTTIAVYTLENGYPTNVDVAAGDPQSTTFTVTLTGDDLILQSPTG